MYVMRRFQMLDNGLIAVKRFVIRLVSSLVSRNMIGCHTLAVKAIPSMPAVASRFFDVDPYIFSVMHDIHFFRGQLTILVG